MPGKNTAEEGTKSSLWLQLGWMDKYFFTAMLVYTLAAFLNIWLKFTTSENIQFVWIVILCVPVFHRMCRDRKTKPIE